MMQPLKILMIMHMRWACDLGAPRVSYELAEEFRRMGHTVDKFDRIDALGTRVTKLGSYFSHVRFTRRAINYVQRNGTKYDVIQAEHGNLPATKRELNFNGVLVARTNGLAHFYLEYERKMAKADRQHGIRRGTLAGNGLRWMAAQMGGGLRDVTKSFEAADTIVLSNTDEVEYVSSTLGYPEKVHLAPNGLSETRFAEFVNCAIAPTVRLRRATVAFVGGWGRRKGSTEFPRIVREIRKRVPDARFLFLGTGYGPETILALFAAEDRISIKVIPHFDPTELPRLLAQATVGLFPSYIEGFPSGVLEMLAAGLPTVGYDMPGTRDMLGHFRDRLMVDPGDVKAIAMRVADLLLLSPSSYDALSVQATQVAKRFRWSEIARKMLDMYELKLNGLLWPTASASTALSGA
jgi:glycosyltransferase involved in cell wall biosynthesis